MDDNQVEIEAVLGEYGCGETVKNGFGFSVSELMARSVAPKEDW